MSMVCGPPNGTTLGRGIPQQSAQKLNCSRCLEGSMREIAMVEGGQAKNAGGIDQSGNRDRRPTPADDKHDQASRVKHEEGYYAEPLNLTT